MLGAIGVVRETLDPTGLVFVHGELWRARAEKDAPLPAGSRVRVQGVADGLLLHVAKADETPAAAPVGAGTTADSA